jgi:hypothetical protein
LTNRLSIFGDNSAGPYQLSGFLRLRGDLRDVFDKGAEQFDVTQCIAYIDPFCHVSVVDGNKDNQDQDGGDASNDDTPCPGTWHLLARTRVSPTVYLCEGQCRYCCSMNGKEDIVDLDERSTRGTGMTSMVFSVDFRRCKEHNIVYRIGDESEHLLSVEIKRWQYVEDDKVDAQSLDGFALIIKDNLDAIRILRTERGRACG